MFLFYFILFLHISLTLIRFVLFLSLSLSLTHSLCFIIVFCHQNWCFSSKIAADAVWNLLVLRFRRWNSRKIFAWFICWVVRVQWACVNANMCQTYTHACTLARTYMNICVFYWLLTWLWQRFEFGKRATCYENFVFFKLFIFEMFSLSSCNAMHVYVLQNVTENKKK